MNQWEGAEYIYSFEARCAAIALSEFKASGHVTPYLRKLFSEQVEYCRSEASYWRRKYLDEKRTGYRDRTHLRHCIKEALNWRASRRHYASQLENEHVR